MKMKRFISLLLALVMVLAMAAPAFAEGDEPEQTDDPEVITEVGEKQDEEDPEEPAEKGEEVNAAAKQHSITYKTNIDGAGEVSGPTEAKKKDQVQVVYTVNDGYTFKGIEVKTVSGETIPHSGAQNGTKYSFTMPDENVIVTGIFEGPETPAPTAYTIEYKLVGNGQVYGFDPENATTFAKPTSANAGDVVYIALAPEEGYLISYTDITTADGTALTDEQWEELNIDDYNPDGTIFYFTMPAYGLLIHVTYTPIPTEYAINLDYVPEQVDLAIAAVTGDAAPGYATEGNAVFFTYEPIDGWGIVSITVTNDTTGETIPFEDHLLPGSNTEHGYRFIMPASSVTIKIESAVGYQIAISVDATYGTAMTTYVYEKQNPRQDVPAGTEVYVDIGFNPAYNTVAKVTVTTVPGGEAVAYNATTNTFIMPESDVKVVVNFEEIPVLPENGTLTITKTNVGGDPDDVFNYTMTMTLDPSVMEISISTVTSWIDKFLKDGGQLFPEDEKQRVLKQLIDYCLGYTNAGAPIEVVGHFTLKGGQSATIVNLEGGIEYKITEAGRKHYAPSANGGQPGAVGSSLTVTGTINGDQTVAFTNTFDGTEIKEDGTLKITKTNVGGDPDDVFNYTMKLTIDPSATDLSISTVTSWIDKFLKDGGKLFPDDEKERVITTLINYLLSGSSTSEPIVVNAHFTLKGGESATIVNLDGGITYEITEAGRKHYAPSVNDGTQGAVGSSLTVTGTIDGDQTVAFTNTFDGTPIKEDGTLKITKTNVGGDQNDVFNYTMTLKIDPTATDLSISTVTSWIDKFLKDGGKLFPDDEKERVITALINYLLSGSSTSEPIVVNAHFTLKGGESATIVNLDGGIEYTITEAGRNHYTPAANGQTGELGGSLTVTGTIDGDQTVAFTNTFDGTEIEKDGTLTITKKNVGGRQNDVFYYNMTLTIDPSATDLSISTVTSWIDKFLKDGGELFSDDEKERVIEALIDYLLGNGSSSEPIVINSTFTLKGGQTATITNLDGGIRYEITEAGKDGYTPAANGQTAGLGESLKVTGTINGNKTIVFKNTYGTIPENGTLTISKTNVGGNLNDVFTFNMKLTIDPSAMDLSISTVTSWIDKFLKDDGALFTEEEKANVLDQLIDYLLGYTGNVGDPIVINSTFTLKHGETATIENMEGGITYEITEAGTPFYTPRVGDQEGTLCGSLTVNGTINGDAAIEFVNTYDAPTAYAHTVGAEGSFKDSIEMRFYVGYKENGESKPMPAGTYAVLTYKDTFGDQQIKRVEITEAMLESYGYMITCNVYAKQLEDVLTLTLEDSEGNPLPFFNSTGTKNYTLVGYQYSLLKYLNKMLSMSEWSALGQAAKDYCYAAKHHFEYGEADTYTLSSAVAAVTVADLERYAPNLTGEMPDGVKMHSITAMFQSDNAFRLYLRFTGQPGDYTYTVDSTSGGAEMLGQNEAGDYFLTFNKVYSNKLGKAHTIEIADETKTQEIKVSVLTYALYVQNDNDQPDSMKTLAKALYLYNRAAVAKFGGE